MALGILKDEATYFNNGDKYIGESGTATNMWVVEDVYDFVTALNPSDKTGCDIYLRLVSNIDFNDHSTYKNGISSTICNSNTFYLYGDNHKIQNIVATDAPSFVLHFHYVEKVDFVNLVAINCSRFPILASTADSCDIGVRISNSPINLAIDVNTNAKITNCTFNVKGDVTGANIVHAYKTNFQACHFNFDVSADFDLYGRVFDSANSDLINTYTNCYFTGRINSTGTPEYFSNFSKFRNCYFAIEWSGERYSQGHNASEFTNCFVDKELFNKNGDNWKSISGVSELTTTQAQDVDCLNSIGFLVAPVK